MHHRPEQGFVIWFTGLSASGKRTLARALARELERRGRRAAVLDGDEMRARLAPDPGVSRADRDAQVARVAYVARLLAEQGAIVLAPVDSPYRAARDRARGEIGRFVEVYVDCPLETCVARDATGLYRRALAGDIAHVPGISDPYEPPRTPEVVVPSGTEPPEASIQRILRKLADLGYLRCPLPSLSAAPDAGDLEVLTTSAREASR